MNIIIDNVDKEKEDDDVDCWIAMATTHPDDTSVDLLIGNIKGPSTIYNMFWFNNYNSHPFCTDIGNIKGTSTIYNMFWFNNYNSHPFFTDKIENIFMSNKTIRICFTEFKETLF